MSASTLRHTRSVRLSRFVGFSVAGLIGVVAVGAGCDQATPLCRTGTGAYTIVYTKSASQAADADCTKAALPQADVVYVNSYNDPGDEGKPDLEKISAALTPGLLASQIDAAEAAVGTSWENPNETSFGWGHFTSSEPQNSICNVPTLTPSHQHLPAIAGSPAAAGDKTEQKDCAKWCDTPAVADIPAQEITYAWSDWKVYFTAAHAGNQFQVHVKYSVDSASCEYDGIAALFGNNQACSGDDPNATTPAPSNQCDAGNGSCKPAKLAYTQDACDFQAHPDEGIAAGSGVDPAFPTTCTQLSAPNAALTASLGATATGNGVTGICTITGAFPSLR